MSTAKKKAKMVRHLDKQQLSRGSGKQPNRDVGKIACPTCGKPTTKAAPFCSIKCAADWADEMIWEFKHCPCCGHWEDDPRITGECSECGWDGDDDED